MLIYALIHLEQLFVLLVNLNGLVADLGLEFLLGLALIDVNFDFLLNLIFFELQRGKAS